MEPIKLHWPTMKEKACDYLDSYVREMYLNGRMEDSFLGKMSYCLRDLGHIGRGNDKFHFINCQPDKVVGKYPVRTLLLPTQKFILQICKDAASYFQEYPIVEITQSVRVIREDCRQQKMQTLEAIAGVCCEHNTGLIAFSDEKYYTMLKIYHYRHPIKKIKNLS